MIIIGLLLLLIALLLVICYCMVVVADRSDGRMEDEDFWNELDRRYK